MNECRFCKNRLKYLFIDLGETPLANSYVKKNNLKKNEHKSPLRVYVCEKCFLVQLKDFESPKSLFQNYSYFSSYSDSWLQHAKKYVEMMITLFSIDKTKLVIEIASNDGYLLQFFKKYKIPVLGIEPAKNIAVIAEKKGIDTISKFFGEKLANELFNENKSADLIIGNNVLAHVPDLNDFIKGLKILLKKDGIITLEFPHLLQLIKMNQFDTIYHEHYSYFSLTSLVRIFSSHDFDIFDVQELSTHGGSLRIFVQHSNNLERKISTNIIKLLDKEKKFGLENIETYKNFKINVEKIKSELKQFVKKSIEKNQKIVCYGAAAKGNTLLNYCKIQKNQIDYVVDKNPYKQGLFLPGTHIPIESPEKIFETKPDYILILPWNIKEEIMLQMEKIKSWGGKFVVPIPELKIYK